MHRHGEEFAAIVRSDPMSAGFQIRFENGWTVSVMFGDGNYAEGNHQIEEGTVVSQTAEVAIFDPDGKCCDTLGSNGPAGWMTPDEVAHVVTLVSNRKRR